MVAAVRHDPRDPIVYVAGKASWRGRAMLDRYGKTAAADPAADADRRLSLGDRI